MFRRLREAIAVLFDGFAYGYGAAPLESRTEYEYLVVGNAMYRVRRDRVRSGRERMVC